MKQIIIAFSVVSICTGCFPRFDVEREVEKKFVYQSYDVLWVKQYGIMDQNFPDLVVVCNSNKCDTLNLNRKFKKMLLSDTLLLMEIDESYTYETNPDLEYIKMVDSIFCLNLRQYTNW